MTVDLTERLCTRCGLCCDGSLFDDVELSGEKEGTALELLGLDIDTDGPPLLLQPCNAPKGTRCEVYKHRPGCCQTFACLLLQRAEQGLLEPDEAEQTIVTTREHVGRIRNLCKRLGVEDPLLPLKDLCIDALAQPVSCDDDEISTTRG